MRYIVRAVRQRAVNGFLGLRELCRRGQGGPTGREQLRRSGRERVGGRLDLAVVHDRLCGRLERVYPQSSDAVQGRARVRGDTLAVYPQVLELGAAVLGNEGLGQGTNLCLASEDRLASERGRQHRIGRVVGPAGQCGLQVSGVGRVRIGANHVGGIGRVLAGRGTRHRSTSVSQIVAQVLVSAIACWSSVRIWSPPWLRQSAATWS